MNLNFLNKSETKLVLVAILLRILIMPFYFHPDIKTYNFQASFLRQGVFNIYSYLEEHKQELPLKEEFVYFPLTYFFLGGYQFMTTPFLGEGFNTWIRNGGSSALEQPETFRYLFILKFPYLVLDIIVAFLLMSLFKEDRDKKRAFLLWLFNPFSITLIYIFSNVDIIAVTLTVLSMVLAQRKRMILAALCLGIGAGFKAYPLIFLPILLLYTQSTKQKVLVTFTALGSLMLVLAPFISSAAFRQTTLLSGLTTRILIPVISLGFEETIFVALIPLSLLFFYIWLKENKELGDIVNYYFVVLVLLYSFIHYHIQWLLWIIPFAVILIVKEERLKWILVFMGILSFSIPLLYNDKSMSVALLRPLSIWYDLAPTPFTIISRIYSPIILQSMIHSLLAGASLAIAWALFVKRKN